VSRARIHSVGPGPVKAVELQLRDYFPFRAGQYLTVDVDGASLPLSIASAPHRLPALHLLYQSSPENPLALAFDNKLTPGGELSIDGPFGDIAITAEQATPLVLIAGGTGAAQALAVIDELTAGRGADTAGPAVTFVWCASEDDRFVRPWPAPAATWLEERLVADPTLGADNAGLVWLGQNLARLRSRRFLLCGSPGFVYAVTDLLTAAGIPPARLSSDVYAYAPRD
jgi:CDP-4-dehydro-6-deoxyglucose reductase